MRDGEAEAVWRVIEETRKKGMSPATALVHVYLRLNALDGIVSASRLEIAEEIHISLRQLMYSLAELEEGGYIERLQGVGRGEVLEIRLREKGCKICTYTQNVEKSNNGFKSSGLEGKGARDKKDQVQQGLRFSTERTESEAKEDCEECRGTGFRMIEVPGREGIFAVSCAHEVARIAGRWRVKELWQDALAQFPVHQVRVRGMSGTQLPLLAMPRRNWEPAITRETLEWRSRQLKGPLFP